MVLRLQLENYNRVIEFESGGEFSSTSRPINLKLTIMKPFIP